MSKNGGGILRRSDVENCSAAPLATVVVPAVPPKAAELLMDKVPAFTKVAPV